MWASFTPAVCQFLETDRVSLVGPSLWACLPSGLVMGGGAVWLTPAREQGWGLGGGSGYRISHAFRRISGLAARIVAGRPPSLEPLFIPAPPPVWCFAIREAAQVRRWSAGRWGWGTVISRCDGHRCVWSLGCVVVMWRIIGHGSRRKRRNPWGRSYQERDGLPRGSGVIVLFLPKWESR